MSEKRKAGRPFKYDEKIVRVVFYCPPSKKKEFKEKVKEILKQYEK